MYKKWHQRDPPDAAEKARNDKIATLQGSRNRLIDNPELVDQQINDLIGFSGGVYVRSATYSDRPDGSAERS